MNTIGLKSNRDIFIEVNGKRLGEVESYSVSREEENRYLTSFGSDQPYGMAGSAPRYRIELSRCAAGKNLSDGVDFFELRDFSLCLVKPGGRVAFSGCRCQKISEYRNAEGKSVEKLSIIALYRAQLS